MIPLHDGVKLVAVRTAIPCSRLFVACTLYKWGASRITGAALRLVDELVTAAVKATGTMDEQPDLTRANFITVHVIGLEASIRIEVWDSSPNRPVLPSDAGGHVKRGCYPVPGGRVVWAELSLLPQPSSSHALRPPPEELGRTQPNPDLLRRVRDGLDSL